MEIVYATDGSEAAAAAGELLSLLPLPGGSRIRVVAVLTQPTPILVPMTDGTITGMQALEEIQAAEREFVEEALRRAVGRLQREGVEVTTEIRQGQPAREVIAAADESGADLLVLGAHGATGLEDLLLGSVARNVAKHCRRPVLIARAPRGGLRRVVLATDGSEHSQHAAQFAARFPLPAEVVVRVVHVLRPYAPWPGLLPTDREEFDATVLAVRERQEEEARALAGAAAEAFAPHGVAVETEVRCGDPAREVLAAAAEAGADLIVAGARGASLIEGLLTGSVADRLLKEAPCSVLLVH